MFEQDPVRVRRGFVDRVYEFAAGMTDRNQRETFLGQSLEFIGSKMSDEMMNRYENMTAEHHARLENMTAEYNARLEKQAECIEFLFADWWDVITFSIQKTSSYQWIRGQSPLAVPVGLIFALFTWLCKNCDSRKASECAKRNDVHLTCCEKVNMIILIAFCLFLLQHKYVLQHFGTLKIFFLVMDNYILQH